MEEIKKITEKINVKSSSLSLPNFKVSRLPVDLKDFIIKYANEHCCGDYGWALSVLLSDKAKDYKAYESKIKELEERLEKLEKEVKK